MMFKRLQRNRLARLARKHKAIARRRGAWFCVECGVSENLESDHILSKHAHPDLIYKLWNLCLRCKGCNLRKSDKFYFEFRTFRVLIRASLQSSFWPSLQAFAFLCLLHYLAIYDLIPIDVLNPLAGLLPPEFLYL